jgi:hypothetical protein
MKEQEENDCECGVAHQRVGPLLRTDATARRLSMCHAGIADLRATEVTAVQR